jgi:hypothetical protein
MRHQEFNPNDSAVIYALFTPSIPKRQAMLTASQVEQYHEEGAVIVPGVIHQEKLVHMKKVLAEFVELSRTVNAHTPTLIFSQSA